MRERQERNCIVAASRNRTREKRVGSLRTRLWRRVTLNAVVPQDHPNLISRADCLVNESLAPLDGLADAVALHGPTDIQGQHHSASEP
ncbi:hypothetical protein NOCA2480069 [metagenome]|uniref:Uncharacterized protein n=1 Tax=metagenome TaxID=256318 RepID=A0A2P2C7T0_9ZZZZ